VRALLDTSAIVGIEVRDVAIDSVNDPLVSVVTIAELSLGVVMAKDGETRALRRKTLLSTLDGFGCIEVDQAVAFRYADLMGAARSHGRRPAVQDTLIAATALVAGIPLITQDVGFLAFPELDVILV